MNEPTLPFNLKERPVAERIARLRQYIATCESEIRFVESDLIRKKGIVRGLELALSVLAASAATDAEAASSATGNAERPGQYGKVVQQS